MSQDVVKFPKEPKLEQPRMPEDDAWKESLKRVARAQAILWSEASIGTRWAILARVDREFERMKK